jgi:AraC-like DNA-binding protein
MESVGTVDAYLSKPVGRSLLGPTYVVWWHSVDLNGLLLWDRPEEEHVRRIIRALDAELAPEVVPHASLIDARRVRAVDLGAFTTLSKYVERRREAFGRLVIRQALLRPGGLAGAAIAGFYSVLSPSYPVAVFTEPADALHWLGCPEEVAVVEELDEIHAKSVGTGPLVVALRAYLEEKGGAATLKETAHAFDTSPRHLQRQLHDASTCFQQEEQWAKVRVAKTLLLDTSYDIKRIALEVGCASPQHFGKLFRTVTGETPSQWRTRRLSIESAVRAGGGAGHPPWTGPTEREEMAKSHETAPPPPSSK